MISPNTFRGFVFERAKDVYDFGSAIPARSPAHIKNNAIYFLETVGSYTRFWHKKILYYHHPWPFKVTHMCISVNVQVVSKKKKAKGIAEQVRGQNLSGLVLVLFLPEPMEGVIVWHFETLICSIYFCACFSSSFLNLEVLMDFQEPVPRGGSSGLAHIAAHIHHIEFSRI